MKLINADALKEQMEKHEKFLKETYCDVGDYEYTSGFSAAKKFVDNAPTIEAEPVKHGQWRWNGKNWECTNCCGQRYHDLALGLDASFCGKCGAKMDLKEDKHES